jgi:membrane protease YdiL (CAAX protease family)
VDPFVGTLLITLVATAAVWATPLASVTTPPGRVLNSVVNFVIQMLILATTFPLAEEIGIRGVCGPHEAEARQGRHGPRAVPQSCSYDRSCG